MRAQVVDAATLPAAEKAAMRETVSKLQRRVLDEQKAAGAQNKRKATEAAVALAAAAVQGNKGFLVARMDVGLDNKAVQEAWKAIEAAHPKLPALLITADAGEWSGIGP